MEIQLNLFKSHTIKDAHLVASSPRKAFYRLKLESHLGRYVIRKESGTGEKVLDRRIWMFDSRLIAEKRFGQRVRQKTDPNRKSPRKYRMEDDIWKT
jgi:hypothetical protein